MSWKSFIVLALVGLSAVSQGAEAQCTSIAAAATDAGLTSLVAAVTATGLAPALSNTTEDAAPLTVFAPTNDAFAPVLAYLNKTLDELSTAELDLVREVLQLHVIPGAATGTDIVDGSANLTTLAGPTLISDGITVSSDGNTANIVTPDAVPGLCGGSVVHLIDTVLLPEELATALAGMMPPMSPSMEGEGEEPPVEGEDSAEGEGSVMPPPGSVATDSTMPPPPPSTGAAPSRSMAAAAAMVALAALVMA